MTDTPNPQRNFDWGPPPAAGEGWQEWGIYVLLLVLLTGGGIVLFSDTQTPSHPVTPVAGLSSPVTPAAGGAGSDGFATAPNPAGNHGNPTNAPNVALAGVATGAGLNPPGDEAVSVVAAPARYEIQLGAFGDEPSARETIAAAATRFQLQATLLPPGTPEDLYRVVAGPFTTEAEAERLATRLNAADFPCFVVESP